MDCFIFSSKIFLMSFNKGCLDCYFGYAYLSRWVEVFLFLFFFNETSIVDF